MPVTLKAVANPPTSVKMPRRFNSELPNMAKSQSLFEDREYPVPSQFHPVR